MKLSISNIAWSEYQDEMMYEFLHTEGIQGLEIAPTRVLGEAPYEDLDRAKAFRKVLKERYDLQISSIQSIWYGKSGNIFRSKEERDELREYTKKAIILASVLGCRNIVFGCPKNRSVECISEYSPELAAEFWSALGAFAQENGTILSLEPNPLIYHTNYINTTRQALALVKEINIPGFRVNLDFGTVIYYEENIKEIMENLPFINHIHISEPYLKEIQRREQHRTAADCLKTGGYQGFVSIEMKQLGDGAIIKDAVGYMKEVFR